MDQILHKHVAEGGGNIARNIPKTEMASIQKQGHLQNRSRYGRQANTSMGERDLEKEGNEREKREKEKTFYLNEPQLHQQKMQFLERQSRKVTQNLMQIRGNKKSKTKKYMQK